MRLIITIIALAATLATTPAQARDRGRDRGGSGNGTAIAAGIAGLAVGALGATVISHRERATTARTYQNYPSGYPSNYRPSYQQGYQPSYQQSYQPSYQIPSRTYSDDLVDGYQQVQTVRQPTARPAPNGVRCLVWNGQSYVPMAC